MKKLDHTSPIPLYHQIKEILAFNIRSKVWDTGELIPTEIELMKEFEVSRTTLRQAINELVQEGSLEKRQGKGTIVKARKLVGSLGRLTGFAEEVMERGYKPYSRLLRSELRSDVYNEKKMLNLDINSNVFIIERIRFADDVPIAIERTAWPEEIGAVLIKHNLDSINFYEVLERHSFYLNKASETISAVNATQFDADLLGINPGEALLEMVRLSFDLEGKPIEYTRTKYRSDSYHYQIDLYR